MLDVQRYFVDIDTSQQHRLSNLLSTIQRDVPPQPSQSYQRVAAESDSDTDDGFYLTSSNQPYAGMSSSTASDDDDDDDDDDWKKKDDTVGSTAGYDRGERASSAKLPLPGIKQEPQESVKQAADMDLTISSSDDEEMASFAAAFDSQPDAAAAGWSGDMDTTKNLRYDSVHVASRSSSKCSDDELTADAWQRLHGNPGACKLKVEDVDDVSDFISEFVNEPVAQPAETTGNISICCCC